MNSQFKTLGIEDYIMHTFIDEQRVIPSDTFDIGGNEYSLLEIMESTDNIIFLRILCIDGLDLGSIYLIPKSEFENKTLSQIQASLIDYKH